MLVCLYSRNLVIQQRRPKLFKAVPRIISREELSGIAERIWTVRSGCYKELSLMVLCFLTSVLLEILELFTTLKCPTMMIFVVVKFVATPFRLLAFFVTTKSYWKSNLYRIQWKYQITQLWQTASFSAIHMPDIPWRQTHHLKCNLGDKSIKAIARAHKHVEK